MINETNGADIWTQISSIATMAAAIITAIGVYLGVAQLKATKQINQTQFEDSLAREYRDIIRQIPVEALLGVELGAEEQKKALPDFYRYIDLTNDQIFLRQQERIGVETWANWRDGIKSLVTMPAFAAAWEHIKNHPTTKFDELRRLEESGFTADPLDWQINSDSEILTPAKNSTGRKGAI